MNDYYQNDDTDRPIFLNNESKPDATVLPGADPATTASAASGAVAGAAWGGGGSLL